MRWSATVGAWARREALFTSTLAAGAGLAALSEPLGAPWLAPAGVFLAAGGALTRLGIAVFRGRLEGSRERAEADRRLRVPVAAVAEVDPTLIGVDPAAQDLLTGDRIPQYVAREIDDALIDALSAAFEGRGSQLVVAVGASKIGKSRSLYEALRACARTCTAAAGLQLLAPVDGDALRALLLPGQEPRLGSGPAVLWLDDVEPFLNQAVTWQTLREWHSGGPSRIVAATYGGKGSDFLVEGGVGEKLTTAAVQLLQHAREIHMTTTTSAELVSLGESITRRASDEERATVLRFGLAAYLVAGPALERKLGTARHAPGTPVCQEGVAVVRAAVDWARCGRTDPITDDVLQQLWPTYLTAGAPTSDEAFTRALDWALRPVAGSVALLYRTGSFTAYDYVVRLIRSQPVAVDPPDETWAAAVGTAEPEQATGVALAAYRARRLTDSAVAFTSAATSTNPETAASAGYNRGFVLNELGRVEEAVTAFRAVIDHYSDHPAAAVREQTAKAMFNMAFVLGDLHRIDEALTFYGQVIDRYGDDPAPALRGQTANTMFNMAFLLEDMDRIEEALTTYGRLIERYGDDPAPALREQTAAALGKLGNRLSKLGRTEEALTAYRQVLDRYGDDPALPLRVTTAKALFNLGHQLGETGRTEESLTTYRRLIDQFVNDDAPDLREQTAKALADMGYRLGELGRSEEALTTYREVLDRYGDDPALPLRLTTAEALLNMSVDLGALGRSEEALSTNRHIVDHYSNDPSPAMREHTSTALGNMGNRLGELGRPREAVTTFRRVADRYGDDPSPTVREQVAIALYNAGAYLAKLGETEEALTLFCKVIDNYGNDLTTGAAEAVRRARQAVDG